MFQKILIAEDYDHSKTGLIALLKEMGYPIIEHSQNCDKALLKLKKALHEGAPFDVLISDLSFSAGKTPVNISTGEALVDTAKRLQPDLNVIVFTTKDQQRIIRQLTEVVGVEGYVCKAENGLRALKQAIEHVEQGQSYLCSVAKASLEKKNVFELSIYEKELLRLLAEGHTQHEIAGQFEARNIKPYSRRSVEDRLSKLRDQFNAKSNPQLIYLTQSLDLI